MAISAPRSKSAGKTGKWWNSNKALMPRTDEEDGEGYYTAWGSENYPGWLEKRFHEAWGLDWFYCKLCKKFMTDEHKEGDGHIKRLEWWLDEKRRRDDRTDESPPRQGNRGGGTAPRDGGGGSAPHGVTEKRKVQ